ncbi:hypothetical protein NHP200010_13710 [Helicobacter bizzozeronii]|uniref:hypothetical protein n=1 Tax=Helicobacter bizzozeronii TaxID=56877 RepID=UPI00244D855A|nr:hypothetical protein [Helicobacter bizzozeronii]GMB93646.1 hypothetical protein NHP200010_13710 [Helicobacter bizzozeronii]
MPIAPKPVKFVCSCGYSKVVSFKSDCLSGADLAQMGNTCPKCNKEMQRGTPSVFDRLFKEAW